MEYKKFFAEIDDQITQYENGTITLSGDIAFSMHKTVRKITHYILSKYFKDPNDETRRFRNIGNAIVDIEWRAKNIDRKAIESTSDDGDYIFALIVNKERQQWMKQNNFGKTIDAIQRKESEYGIVMPKKTQSKDKLTIEPVRWENTIVDPSGIKDGIKIEKNYLTPLELKKKAEVWDESTGDESNINLAIKAAKKARTSGSDNRIEVLDIEGEFEKCLLYDTEEGSEEDDTIGLYNVIQAVVGQEKFVLYKTELDESRFKFAARKEVEGRDMGMGVWEEVFEPQIATNENVLDEREAMSLGGKVVITTNKKNVASGMALVNGEVIDLEADEFFKPVSLAPTTLPQYQNIINAWFENTQRDQSAYPGVTGEEPKASTPAQSLQLQAAQGASIFNKRRDQDGFFLTEIINDWVDPFWVGQVNAEHVLTASYSARELQLIDEDIRTYMVSEMGKQDILNGEPVTADMMAGYHSTVDRHFKRQGNKRALTIPKGYITLKRIQQKTSLDITDEMTDSQRKINTLATALQGMDPADPDRKTIIQEMMELGGTSPASFNAGNAAPVQPQTTATPKVQSVLPDAQKV